MKKSFLILATALLLMACGGNTQKKAAADTIHAAKIALNYEGKYKGVLPAADCPGIEVTLTLHNDSTYNVNNKYIDRKTVFDERGHYVVKGTLLTLNPADGEAVSYYQVEENRLRRLDAEKQPITGALADYYVLNKTI